MFTQLLGTAATAYGVLAALTSHLHVKNRRDFGGD